MDQKIDENSFKRTTQDEKVFTIDSTLQNIKDLQFAIDEQMKIIQAAKNVGIDVSKQAASVGVAINVK